MSYLPIEDHRFVGELHAEPVFASGRSSEALDPFPQALIHLDRALGAR